MGICRKCGIETIGERTICPCCLIDEVIASKYPVKEFAGEDYEETEDAS